jgi:hypothetical protein
MLGMENYNKEFNLVPRIIGSGGSFLKHITTQTTCKVMLKGIGSGFLEGPERKGRQTYYN